jgi:hypothetical protein
MRDGFGFTNPDAGSWFLTIARLAWSAAIPYFLACLVFNKGHWFFTEDVNLIRSYFKDICRTNLLALPASIAFVRIDGDIPVSRAILETIIGNHVFSMLED